MAARQQRVRPKSSLRRQASAAVKPAVLLSEHLSRYLRLMRLHRPIGIWLLLWPTLWALWLAADGVPPQSIFIIFVLGTIIVRSAGCIINDLADRKIDRHVWRTADRPLATGEVAPAEALFLFIGLMLIALGLVMTLNRLTLYLAAGGAFVTVIYPFMKRFISMPQLVLGIAFGLGVPMAYSAQLGEVPRVGWLLYLTSIVWVLIYDTEYAMADREDDRRLGVKSMALLFGEMDRMILAGLQLIFIGGLVLIGQTVQMGPWYYAGLVAVFCFDLRQQYLIRHRTPEKCVHAFLNNAWLGGVVFAGIVLDYLYR